MITNTDVMSLPPPLVHIIIIITTFSGKIEVHNPYKLESHVLNRYFRHSKFASFQRQLNYFGFRKLAGKGKMAPCSYVNEATGNDIGSLLTIKVRDILTRRSEFLTHNDLHSTHYLCVLYSAKNWK